MHLSHFVRGILFAPAFIALILILKAGCPTDLGTGCFADYLATPIFLPLIIIYKIFGYGFLFRYELAFITIFWSLVGALIGYFFDIRKWAKERGNYQEIV